MRRHPKASAVGSTLGAGVSRASTGSAFATRGASRDCQGSGAPSIRGRAALIVLALAALTLLACVPLAQAKVVVNGFGTAGSLGGQFGGPKGIAVNNTGNGGVPAGTTYVADTDQHRIQRFSPTGVFERAWGQNVAGRDERQTVTLTNAGGGSFTLSFGGDTTAPISLLPSDSADPAQTGMLVQPTASTVQSALTALPSIAAGNVSVTGGATVPGEAVFTVRFVGVFSGADVAQLTANSSAMTGPSASTLPTAVSVATVEQGSGGNNTGFEICTVAANCQEGLGTTTVFNGGYLREPEGVAVDQSDGHVYVADAGNRRVQEYDADGNFVRLWGWDVLGINEIQTLVVNATAGQYKLTFGPNTTANINFNATAAVVQTALTGLASVGAGNATVTLVNAAPIRTYTITFTGALAGTNVEQITTSAGTTPLSGGTASATVTTTQTGSGGNNIGAEICTVATECKTAAAAGPNVGRFGFGIGNPAIDASGNVYIPDQTNNRIQVFDTNGNFLKMAGGDVITNGAEGTGNLTSGSTTVSNLVTTKKFFEVGQTVTAASGIQAETKITAVTATSLTLSKAANATAPGQTLTVAAGAGNSSANEVQTITVGAGVTGGKFNLSFNGQSTGATGIGSLTRGSKVITNVSTTTGAFAVGQGISQGLFASNNKIPRGATITAIDTVAGTMTMSETFTEGNGSNQTLTGHDLSLNSSAATIQAKLEGLSNIDPGEVAVSGPNGGPWTVEFQGSRYSATDVPALVPSVLNLAPRPSTNEAPPPISITVTSANPYEVCSVAAECRIGASGVGLGQFSETSPGDIAFDSSGNVYALDAGGKRALKFDSSLGSPAVFGAAAFSALTAGNSAPERLAAVQGGSRLAFSVINVAASSERQILELDTSGTLQETSLAGSGLTNINGLAANDAAGTLLATTTSAASPRRVLRLGAPLADPTMLLDPVTAKADTTATFSGTVDPKGGLVSCLFQYSTDQTVWIDVKVPGCDSLSPSGGAQAVSANATGLIPGKQYFVRLSVSRPLVAGSTKSTSPKTFATDGVVPAVTNVSVLDIQDTSARVVATIDPRNSQSSWAVQYGTTPSLGSSTSPINIGSGSTPQIVSQVVSGLSPNTTYYYKVVATNLVGAGSSSTKSFKTRANPQPLPGGRSYEMVSPANKNGGSALSGFNTVVNAPNGEAVGFCTTSIFAEGQQSFLCADYASHRSATGWKTKAAAPRFCRFDFDAPGSDIGTQNSQRIYFSRNLDSAVLYQPENGSEECTLPPLVPGAPLPQRNLYRENLLGDSFDYQLLAPVPSIPFFGPPSQGTGAGYVAGDDHLSHIVYETTGQQTPDGPSSGSSALYEWDEGTLRFLAKDPSGNPVDFARTPNDSVNGVSSDGERIFFEGGFPNEIYLREGGTASFDVSASECTSSCGAAAADLFQYGAEDGSRALFRSSAKLTDDDNSVGFDANSKTNADLFLYTHSANPATDTNLRLLSKDNESSDGTGAEVIGVQGISDDATVVYFVAKGQIVPGKSTAPGPKLYRWDLNGGSPMIEYLARLNSNEASENWGFNPEGIANRMVTPDGKYVLAGTRVAIDPVADTDADFDAYRWDQSTGWVCTTCQAPGKASVGNTILRYLQLSGDLERPRSAQRRIIMSDDGQRVFFNSLDALVPGDVNGEGGCPAAGTTGGVGTTFVSDDAWLCQDAYEWHDGTFSLLTTGTSKMPADGMLLGASADGRDVFIFTDERLVGWDTDENGDIYDVRIGGGFPEPPLTGAPCEGESCRGATPAPPAQSGAGTAAFEGPSNPPSKEGTKPRRCPAGKKKVTKNGKTRCVKQGKGEKKQGAKKRANNDRRAAR